MKVIFFGTPDFGVPCLKALAKVHEVAAVVTQPDRAGDRGSIRETPVKAAAKTLGIPVLQFDRVRDHLSEIASYGAEMGVTAAYGQILTQAMLDAFPRGILNVHGSVLPRYRGAAPIQWAVINGERETGITIMQTARGVDCGDILAVLRVAIGDDETAGALFARLSERAPDFLIDTVARLEQGEIISVPQDEALATHFPMLSKDTGRIDWTKSAREIYNLFRGTYPWPGATFALNGQTIKIHACGVADGSGEPGETLCSGSALLVACGDGALRIDRMQAAGGKNMSAEEYLRGHFIAAGTMLC